MKKSICLLFSFLFISGLSAQNKEYVLNGIVPNTRLNGSVIYLYGIEDSFKDLTALDSTLVVDGKFSFKRAVADDPDFQIVSIGRIDSDGLSAKFVAEAGNIEVTLDTLPLTGGTKGNDAYNALTNSREELYSKMSKIQVQAEAMQNSGNLTEDKVTEMKAEFDIYGKKYRDLTYNYIKNNISNRLGEYSFVTSARGLSLKQLDELYNLTRDEFRQTEVMKQMHSLIEAQKPQPYDGGRFKDIELSTPDGKVGSISDYVGKGKVVLIDFWASWCGPCRRDMPRLVSLYEKYKDKGFEILGISLDNNLRDWTKAMESMNMAWPNISDLGGWQSKAARLYNVNQIPQSFLVDKKGNIVGKDLKQDALIYKIEELLDASL